MNESSRVKVAAAVTALFLGGITAAGLISREGAEQPATAGSTQTEVIHRKKVRTVRAPSAPAPAPATPFASAAAPVAAPQPVSTRVSPSGGEDDEDEYGEYGGEDEEGE
jgi:hypothetical protein